MEFFAKVFDALSSISAKLPSIEVGAYFIITAVVLVLTGLIVGITFVSTAAGKMKRACKKVLAYLARVEEINDDNAGDFTSTCFGNSVPRALRDTWVEYLGVRFGYPSDVMSEASVFDREVKKPNNIRANVYIGIALILVAVLAFWGLGANPSVNMGVIVGAGLLISGIIYLVLAALARKQFNMSRELFYEMQDELDAKVDFHVEKDYSTDASPLLEFTAIIDEIIARNTAKVVSMPTREENESSKTSDVEVKEEENGASEEDPVSNPEKEEAAQTEAVAEEATPIEEQALETEIVEQSPIERLAEEAETPAIEEVAEVAEEVEEPAMEELVTEPSAEEVVSEEQVEAPAENTALEQPVEEIQPELQPSEEAVAEDLNESAPEKIENADTPAEVVASEIEETPTEESQPSEEQPAAEFSEPETVDTKEAEPVQEAPAEDLAEDIFNTPIGTASITQKKAQRNVLKDEGVGDWLAGQNEFAMASPVEAFEEVNIEDEEVMFGKKKKEAAVPAAVAQQQAPVAAPKAARQYADSDVYAESEIILETPAPAVAETPAAPVTEPVVEAPAAKAEEPAKEELPEFKRTIIEASPVPVLEPEIIEEIENLDEGDEDIKAPRLVQLPHLIDYYLSAPETTKAVKMKMAELLLRTYASVKNTSPENAAIVKKCVMKVMADLTAKK